MKISFVFDYGEKPEIGTGHKFRCQTIEKELKIRKHDIVQTEDADIVIIDHIFSQQDIINRAKEQGKKVVLIDGAPDDVGLVDLSISAVINKASKHRGLKYVVFPKDFNLGFYNAYGESDKVFVAMGGFDFNNYSDLVIGAVQKAGMKAVVVKSINMSSDERPDINFFEGLNYFDAMRECKFAITNGGLTLFQAMYFGMPCLAIPQYEHQKENISAVSCACVPTNPVLENIVDNILWLNSNADYRSDLSKLSKRFVDGKGVERVCDLIESIL